MDMTVCSELQMDADYSNSLPGINSPFIEQLSILQAYAMFTIDGVAGIPCCAGYIVNRGLFNR